MQPAVHHSPLHSHHFSQSEWLQCHLFIRELGEKFDSGSILVILENNKKHISFRDKVIVGECEMSSGKIKPITKELHFIDSFRFMASRLDSLARNLVGMNGMMCEGCGSETELTHIDENHVTHGTCVKWRGASHGKLEITLIFDNLRVDRLTQTNSSDCCSERELIPMNT